MLCDCNDQGYGDECNTWEPVDHLNCSELICDYEQKNQDEKLVNNKKKEEYVVERILDHRWIMNGTKQFFLKWKGMLATEKVSHFSKQLKNNSF